MASGRASGIDATAEPTTNRTPPTAEMQGNTSLASEGEACSGVHQPGTVSGFASWKPGTDSPPFVTTNTLAISMLVRLHDGMLETVPSLVVSEAVAVQIWRLVYDPDVRVEALRHIGDRGIYIILASLTLGVHVKTADLKRVDALRQELGRKVRRGSSDRLPGLAYRLRDLVNKRTQSRANPLFGMNADEAREHLLRQWDLKPFAFDYGVAPTVVASGDGGGGGGGGDGGDGGGGGGGSDDDGGDVAHTRAPPAGPTRPAELNWAVRAFAAASVQEAFFSPPWR